MRITLASPAQSLGCFMHIRCRPDVMRQAVECLAWATDPSPARLTQAPQWRDHRRGVAPVFH
jgi:hypothetical protein